jgi:Transposase DDE domain group 1
LRRFFALIDLKARIQRMLAAQQLGGDYGASHLILLVIGLLVVGERRLSHLRYVANDPLFARLCGLSRIPTDRTVVHSKGAEAFVRQLLAELRERFGRSLPLEFRMDAVFFQQNLLKLLLRHDCYFAVKVPFCKWTGVKTLVGAQRCWSAVGADIDCFETRLALAAWGLELRVVTYRKRGHHRSVKNYQLDLFSPDDGYFEYCAVATNLTLTPRALWYFAAGRGAQEKTIAELKGEFALDAVPTNQYGANSVWLQLCILTHNLMRSFQLHLRLATPKPPISQAHLPLPHRQHEDPSLLRQPRH